MRYELHISKIKLVDARLKSGEKRQKNWIWELELERYLDLGTGAGTLSPLMTLRPGALGATAA